jgi:hypothetical protein
VVALVLGLAVLSMIYFRYSRDDRGDAEERD